MPAWLRDALARDPIISPQDMALRLVAALVLGYVIAWIYLRSRREDADVGASFPMTLVLLSVLIAMVTQVIGNNVARAFSLVGTLSIVRFRTVVRDTRDTAYVIFAVVIGMASGAADLWVALMGLAVIGFAALLLPISVRSAVRAAQIYELRLRVALGHNPESVAGAVLDDYLDARVLISMGTSRPGVSLDYSYEARMKPGRLPQELAQALSMVEGLQEVRVERRPVDRL
ncbi:MAG TPA: DUF4956 domain-containing protein [Steroidobacteraceae bacterium]|nr:DUF4956 domain-containing protein [Steroidobacteraceae bacterium]